MTDKLEDVEARLRARLDENGHEVPDPRPPHMPAGFRRPETLAEQVQRLVRTSLSRQAEEQGFESFEEAEDFDVGEDELPATPYETFFDPVLGREITPHEFHRNERRYQQEMIEKQRDHFAELDRMHEIKQPRKRAAKEGAPNSAPSNDKVEPAGSGE